MNLKNVIVIGLLLIILTAGCTAELAKQAQAQRDAQGTTTGPEGAEAGAGTQAPVLETEEVTLFEPLSCASVISSSEISTVLGIQGNVTEGILGGIRDIKVSGEAALLECNFGVNEATKKTLDLPVGNTVLIMKAKCYYRNADGSVDSGLIKRAFGQNVQDAYIPPADKDLAVQLFEYKKSVLNVNKIDNLDEPSEPTFDVTINPDLISQAFYDAENDMYYGLVSRLPNCLVSITNMAPAVKLGPQNVSFVAQYIATKLDSTQAPTLATSLSQSDDGE